MTQDNQKEQWEKLVCSCKKEWLDDNTHYASCPVFQVQKAIAQAKEERFREGVERALEVVEEERVKDYNERHISDVGYFNPALEDLASRLKKLIEEER